MTLNKNQRQAEVREGARILTEYCAQIRPDDRTLIVTDEVTEAVGTLLYNAASELTDTVTLNRTETTDIHGGEPDAETAKLMQESDVTLAATQSSLAHSHARFSATQSGARFLSLPDYDLKQLARPSLRANFPECAQDARRVANAFEDGKEVRIQTGCGTHFETVIEERSANFCPGFCSEPGAMGSPPDIETNIAPVETKSTGTVVVDGSIPCQQLGLIEKPVVLDIKNGQIRNIKESGPESQILQDIFDEEDSQTARVVAEIGLGLNPKAELCGRMLEDEGCRGTLHLGIGSNDTIGGENKIDFHLDLVLREPTVSVDDKPIMNEGDLVI